MSAARWMYNHSGSLKAAIDVVDHRNSISTSGFRVDSALLGVETWGTAKLQSALDKKLGCWVWLLARRATVTSFPCLVRRNAIGQGVS